MFSPEGRAYVAPASSRWGGVAAAAFPVLVSFASLGILAEINQHVLLSRVSDAEHYEKMALGGVAPAPFGVRVLGPQLVGVLRHVLPLDTAFFLVGATALLIYAYLLWHLCDAVVSRANFLLFLAIVLSPAGTALYQSIFLPDPLMVAFLALALFLMKRG